MASVLSPAVPPEQQKPALSQTHPFTCNTCQVAFRLHEAQRGHYHTDWHQYNLKRKVASLPPLSSETFAEKVLHAQASTRIERERATFEKACKPCNKTYYSENAYTNHLGSQKHRQNVATQQMNAIRAGGSARGGNGVRKERDEKDETGSVVSSTFSLGEPAEEEPAKEEPLPVVKADSHDISGESTPTATETPAQSDDDQRALPLEACLFCPYASPSLTLNVAHMTKAHGLFIPEASFLVDLPGLITYLGQKLVLGNQCLYCSKTKGGVEGIRTHMQDKGHTMLGFETEEQQVELGQFYDFRSTYSDAGEESESSDEADAGRKLKPKAPKDDEGWEAEGGEGEGWETDSDTSIDSTELGTIPVDPEHGHGREGGRRHHMQDGWHSHAHGHIYHDEYELHLPSGRSVGHRSLARYYKQNLREHPLQDKAVRRLVDTPYPHSVEHDEDDDDTDDGGVEVEESEERALNRWERRGETRALARRGEAGMIGVSVAKRHEAAKLEKRGQIEEQRGRRRYEWGVNKVGNSQKHFRDPLLQ